MKSIHCVMSHRRFDDQYSFDFDGFMTKQEFVSKMRSFNEVIQRYPPPPSFSSGIFTMVVGCFSTLVVLGVIAAIHYTHHLVFILVVPLTFLFLSSILMTWRRRLKKKFEGAILDLCSCMNATDNVRGINFRFSKLSPKMISQPNVSLEKSIYYAITIEFDERYNLLHHFSTTANSNNRSSLMMDTIPPYKPTVQPPLYTPSVDSPVAPPNSYQPNEKL